MLIKILGTSNGFVTGGYGDHLKHSSKIKVVQNLSIGSSHPTVIMNGLAKNDLSKRASYIILDVCVNEQRAKMRGLYDSSISEALFSYFLSYCYENSIKPLILLLPVMNSDGKLLSESVTRWKRLCEKNNVLFLDVIEFSATFGEPRNLWRDANHPSIDFSKIIANKITEMVIDNDYEQFVYTKCTNNFKIIPVNKHNNIYRETRLFSATFGKYYLNQNFSYQSDERQDFKVLGFSLDMAHTHAALKFEGENQVIQRYDNSFFNEDRSLWLVSWSLVSPAYSKNGKISFEVIKPEDSVEHMMNDHTKKIPDNNPIVAELETMLIQYI